MRPNMSRVPDPKVIADSIVGGAFDIAELPINVAQNVASIAAKYAGDTKGNFEMLRHGIPEDPSAAPKFAVNAVTQTVGAGVGMVEGVINGVMQTVNGVRSEINRAIR